MRKSEWFKQALEELHQDPEYLAERLALRSNKEIRRRMAELGLTQDKLAERLGVSQAYVSRLLNYSPNMTLRSLTLIAHALEAEWDFPHLIASDAAINKLTTFEVTPRISPEQPVRRRSGIQKRAAQG